MNTDVNTFIIGILILCFAFLLGIVLITGIKETEDRKKSGIKNARWVYVGIAISTFILLYRFISVKT